MYVLVFTLLTTGQVAFYSGDQNNRQNGRPTLFPTLALCEETRGPQIQKMIDSRKANPNLPPFTLECREQSKMMDSDKNPPAKPEKTGGEA